jgi:tRNA-binding EMAP/Myf-like protein
MPTLTVSFGLTNREARSELAGRAIITPAPAPAANICRRVSLGMISSFKIEILDSSALAFDLRRLNGLLFPNWQGKSNGLIWQFAENTHV